MSYNINTFKVKKLENLIIPISSLYKCKRIDFHPEAEYNLENDKITFYFMESKIIGYANKDKMLNVIEIYCCGEGSGTFMNYVIEPALEDSTGELIASCVWEGGDTINRLIVKNGHITWENIEI